MTQPRSEIQTCTNWRGDDLALYELEGGIRHRWHCFECDDHGLAEVDGAVCTYQLKAHMITRHAFCDVKKP